MRRLTSLLGCLATAGVLGWVLTGAAHAAEPTNLALKKPAKASSVEDGNPVENAFDGDGDTRWCASDGSVPQWLQVDLKEAKDLGAVEIKWEMDAKAYQYVLEGSADEKEWKTLNDQQAVAEKVQVHKLLADGKGVRYVRVRVTGLEEGSYASIFEFKVIDAESFAKLPEDVRKTYWKTADPDLAQGKKATASSEEDGHPAGDAFDGKPDTRWCNNGADVPAWLQVDLEKPATLSGIGITWEKADARYRYKVEGSADGKEWKLLSDQTKTEDKKQSVKLPVKGEGVRYVKLTITETDEGAWPSLFALTVNGKF